MLTGLNHKDNLYRALPLQDKNALKLRELIEEKRRIEERFSTGAYEKGIQTSNAKDDLVFALVRLGSVLYTHGICEAGKCKISYFMRLKHNDLIQNAAEFIEIAKENSSLLKKAGIDRQKIREIQLRLDRFQSLLEEDVLSFC